MKNDLGLTSVELLAGIFPEETGHRIDGKAFAFVHLDVDVYQSTKDAFDYVWQHVSRSGVVAFDDYGFMSACPGTSRFVDEIRNDPDKLFIANLNGQAYIIKK